MVDDSLTSFPIGNKKDRRNGGGGLLFIDKPDMAKTLILFYFFF